jgi:hypothetical protein
MVHTTLGNIDAALQEFNHALELDPDLLSARKNRAIVLYEASRVRESLADFASICRRDASDLSAQCGAAAAHFALGDLEAARTQYDQVLQASASHPDANWNLALINLTEGHLTPGWDGYEWRWRTKLAWPERHPPEPAWNGEYVHGTLLLWGEQGVGDEIFFAGMIDDASKWADALVVETDPRLVPIYERSFPNVRSVARGSALPDAVNCRIPMGSVGRLLRRTWRDVPKGRTGYLRADPAIVTEIRTKLEALGNCRLRVGLSWRSHRSPLATAKSIGIEALYPMFSLPDVQFVDLQYGDTSIERRRVDDLMDMTIHHIPEIDNSENLDALSALICACDVVVSTSNVTAHLAAALGRKVLLLIPFAQGSLWYWHRDSEDNPWYPTVTTYRQSTDGSWHAAIDRITTDVRRICNPG